MAAPTSTNNVTSRKLASTITSLWGKIKDTFQTKLTTQTAYSAKGTATKVPQITTNSLGQVTGITEVDINAGGFPMLTNDNVSDAPKYWKLGTTRQNAQGWGNETFLIYGDGDIAHVPYMWLICIKHRGTTPTLRAQRVGCGTGDNTASTDLEIGSYLSNASDGTYTVFIKRPKRYADNVKLLELAHDDRFTIDVGYLGDSEPSGAVYDDVEYHYVPAILDGRSKGSSTVPVYIDSNSRFQECNVKLEADQYGNTIDRNRNKQHCIYNLGRSTPYLGWMSVVKVASTSESYRSVVVRGKFIIGNGNWCQNIHTVIEFQAVLQGSMMSNSYLVATPAYIGTIGESGDTSIFTELDWDEYIRLGFDGTHVELQVNFKENYRMYGVFYTVECSGIAPGYVAQDTIVAAMSNTSTKSATYDYGAGKVLGYGGSEAAPVYVDTRGVVHAIDVAYMLHVLSNRDPYYESFVPTSQWTDTMAMTLWYCKNQCCNELLGSVKCITLTASHPSLCYLDIKMPTLNSNGRYRFTVEFEIANSNGTTPSGDIYGVVRLIDLPSDYVMSTEAAYDSYAQPQTNLMNRFRIPTRGVTYRYKVYVDGHAYRVVEVR